MKNLKIAPLLIKQYEDEHYAIPYPDVIKAIKLMMDEKVLRKIDLVGKIGSKGCVSAILNKRKPLTLELAKWFHTQLGIPTETFFCRIEVFLLLLF